MKSNDVFGQTLEESIFGSSECIKDEPIPIGDIVKDASYFCEDDSELRVVSIRFIKELLSNGAKLVNLMDHPPYAAYISHNYDYLSDGVAEVIFNDWVANGRGSNAYFFVWLYNPDNGKQILDIPRG